MPNVTLRRGAERKGTSDGQPVGSHALQQSFGLEVSRTTIRNGKALKDEFG